MFLVFFILSVFDLFFLRIFLVFMFLLLLNLFWVSVFILFCFGVNSVKSSHSGQRIRVFMFFFFIFCVGTQKWVTTFRLVLFPNLMGIISLEMAAAFIKYKIVR
jgi:hypothetical protein